MFSQVTLWFNQIFVGLMPILSVWTLGITGLIGCIILAWFLAPIRVHLAIVAVLIVSHLVSFQFGGHYEGARVQAQWDLARQAAIDEGNSARAKAERDIAAQPPTERVFSDDPYNRDNWKK